LDQPALFVVSRQRPLLYLSLQVAQYLSARRWSQRAAHASVVWTSAGIWTKGLLAATRGSPFCIPIRQRPLRIT